MRFTVYCYECDTKVADSPSMMDALETKKRHDIFRGHDAAIELYRGAS